MHSLRGALAALVTGVAAALVVVALAILPFLNPVWVGFAQGRAQAEAWTGFTTEQLAAVTNPILVDLVVGPPDFDVTLDGVAGAQGGRARATCATCAACSSGSSRSRPAPPSCSRSCSSAPAGPWPGRGSGGASSGRGS